MEKDNNYKEENQATRIRLDEITDIELTESNNNFDPSSINKGSDLKIMQQRANIKKKEFNKYQSFSELNRNGGFIRMAGFGFLIALAAFIVLFFILKQ